LRQHLLTRHASPFTVGAALLVLAGCAVHHPPQAPTPEHSPVPVWLSDVVGCNRAQLDREWSQRRYVPILRNDTACVALGRFGEPREETITHEAGVGTLLSLDWNGLVGPGGARVVANRGEPTGKSDWPTSYFRIWSWAPPPPVKVDTSRTAAIIGSVLDSLGNPWPRGVRVCAIGVRNGARSDTLNRCTRTLPGGSYRLDSLPVGWIRLTLSCETPHVFPQQLPPEFGASASRPVGAASVTLVRTFRGCDPRPVRTMHGRFAGHWSRGFEENVFVPCARSSWRIASDSISPRVPGRIAAWVTALPKYKSAQWPAQQSGASPNGSGGYVSYVEWSGTVTGPDHYGHLGVAEWRIDVDSIIAMRAVSRRDCAERGARSRR